MNNNTFKILIGGKLLGFGDDEFVCSVVFVTNFFMVKLNLFEKYHL